MQKTKLLLTLSLVILASFLVTGCFNKEASQESGLEEKQVEKNSPSSLSGWLGLKNGTICNVSSDEGEITMKAKGDKVRMDGIAMPDYSEPTSSQSVQGSSIFDGDWVYSWTGEKGMMFNVKEMQALAEEMGEAQVEEEDMSWEKWANDAENDGFEYDCREANVDSNSFIPPENVEFVDLTEMMKGFGEAFGGIDATNMNQEDVEAQLESIMGDFNLEDFNQ